MTGGAGCGGRWRAVAVLLEPCTVEAARVAGVLERGLSAESVRVYGSGGHLVVVTTMRAGSASDAARRLHQRLHALVPTSTTVADVWSGHEPLAA